MSISTVQNSMRKRLKLKRHKGFAPPGRVLLRVSFLRESFFVALVLLEEEFLCVKLFKQILTLRVKANPSS